MRFGDAKVIPFIPIEGLTKQALRAAKESPIGKRSHIETDFEAQAALARNDITSFAAEGRDIRNEVEGLIVWRRYMGEGSGSSTWGPVQQAHAAHWIKYQRARLAKLKSSIETDGKNVAGILEYIFGGKSRGRYDEAVTKQAREELGLLLTGGVAE